MFVVQHAEDGRSIQMVRQSDGKAYTFTGGWASEYSGMHSQATFMRFSQDSYEMIARWLDSQGIVETPLSLHMAFDEALRWEAI